MQIKTKIQFVEGDFDTDTGALISVQRKMFASVELCFKEQMNIPFAAIKLHSKDLRIDAMHVFESAAALGDEICRRWNEFPKWVSVKDRLPILASTYQSEQVIAYSDGNGHKFTCASIFNEGKFYMCESVEDGDHWTDNEMHYVTHWMPLPNGDL